MVRKVNDPFPFRHCRHTHVHKSVGTDIEYLGTIEGFLGIGASESDIVCRFKKQLLLDPEESVLLHIYYSNHPDTFSGECIYLWVYWDNPYLCTAMERLALAQNPETDTEY